jgi:iron complex outermembrane recepter protein
MTFLSLCSVTDLRPSLMAKVCVTGWNYVVKTENVIRPHVLLISFLFFLMSATSTYAVDCANHFNIPRQPANNALIAIGQQADVTVIFRHNSVKKYFTNTLNGCFTLSKAIEVMLANTGLKATIDSGGDLIISEKKVHGEIRMENNKRNFLATVIGFFVSAGGVAQESKLTEGGLVMEEVVVTATGYRESLEKAMEIKRYGTGFVDAIVATDIASFPDQNLAEALQRIPGVAIERSGGQGTKVSIRSLGPGYTHSTINGLNAASSSGGRELQYDLFSSDLVQTVSVKKSPTASDEEGGIAGTVAIRTTRPFDYDGFKVVVAAEGAHNSVSEEVDPRLAFLVSNTFADDTVGVLLGLTSEDRTHRANWLEMANNYTFGSLDDDLPDGVDSDAYYLGYSRSSTQLSEQEKRGALLAVQYQPTENLLLGTDIMVGTYQNYGYLYQNQVKFKSASDVISATLQDNATVAASFADVDHFLTSYASLKDTEFWQAGFNADWQSDIWTIKGFAAFAQSDEEETTDKYYYDSVADNGYVLNGHGFDLLTLPDISTYYANLRLGEERTKADEKSMFKLDFERLVDVGWIDNIQFGVSYSGKSTARDKFKGRLGLADSNRFADDDGALAIGDFLPGGNTLISGYDGFPNSFVAVPYEASKAQYGDLDLGATEDIGNYFKIEEDIFAAYLQSDFEFDIAQYPTKLNVGLRYIDTEQSSGGYFSSTEEPIPRKQTVERGYDHWLPSVNMVTEFSDQLNLRLAAATVITRPALSSLTGKFSVNEGNKSISAGNPYLDPTEANQYDVALEYYFAPESLVALGYFYKELKTYETSSSRGTISYNGDTYDYKTTENAEGAVIEGAEFIYQQPFTFLPAPFDGFGLNFNYTYIESTAGTEIAATGAKAPLKNLSRDSFNTVLYYEKAGFDIRFAYNYKGKSVLGINQGSIIYTADDYGQLDISAGYQINDNIKVTLKGINITEEHYYQYSDYGRVQLPYKYISNGRRVSLGVRITW